MVEHTAAREAAAACRPVVGDWRSHLEIIGAALFLRYRKRLMSPGITLEIWREFPGLSLLDVLVRVHAGRKIIRDGDDLHAVQVIRSGHWQRHQDARAQRQRRGSQFADDRLSKALVNTGGVIFAGFCVLSLVAGVAAEVGGWQAPAAGATLLGGSAWWWLARRAPRARQDRGGPASR